ncbi:MAG: hypothetical protein LBG21_01250 [Campylobacteraceae bacterium]|jgi:hypothetical protein|nr:hypothetical protein [Campylobacteraceae bacterium]
MKIILFFMIAILPAFAEMPVYEFTSDITFNFYYSIFVNLAVVLVPIFGALSLIRS